MEDLTGKQLGPYQIVTPLGEGGMAAVFKAYQPSMDRYVALKVLPRHFASDPEFIGRFSQEARVIANLQHPHILPVHDFGESDGYTYLVMRFVEGGTLSDWLKPRTPLGLEKTRDIIAQIGGALDYAHAQGVIHRDIKPSNILVDQWENCLLTDFGLAKMVASSSHLTQTGGILGTPAYMSPEQGLGKTADHRSDIYSLGVVLYQMSVGYLPYQAETPMAVVIKHIHDPLPPPRRRDPNLPEAVERVILKALAKNPEDRFATAGDMVKALQRAVELPTVAVTPTPAEPPAPPPPPPSEPETAQVEPPAPAPPPEPVQMETSPDLSETAIATPTPLPSEPEPAKKAKKSKRSKFLIGIGALLVLGVIIVALGALFGDGGDIAGPDRPADSAISGPTGAGERERDAPPPEDLPRLLEDLLQQVESAYNEGDTAKAGELLDEAIALAPDLPDLYCQRGYVLRDSGALRQAAAAFENCSSLAGDQGNRELQSEGFGMMVLSQAHAVLIDDENAGQALRIIDDSLGGSLTPDWMICERGEINLSIEDTEAAMADFETCQSMDGVDEYWRQRSRAVINELEGQRALDREEYTVAVEHFRQWAELESESPWPFCYLGEAYAGAGDVEGATAAFEQCQAIADSPDALQWASVGLITLRADEAVERREWDAALQAYQEAIDISPDEAWIYCERGSVFMAMEVVDEARQDFQTCLEMSGDDDDVRQWAEDLLHDLNDAFGG